ncbi:unnamed protein product [Nippostrongylus brasiliensis]|uniref:Putative syntaxin-2 (inferred by orthology to a C. elegans protein) n=1 Tax=Nippostrongylus brasiliensis TaxID=27835 RepID=A0A0N4XWH9_NIPBR|nr:unnamed protein product [Nippostrongylus brasiliensis]
MRDRLADFQRRVVTDRFEEVELGPPEVTAVPYHLANALDSRLVLVRKVLDELSSEIESLHRKQQHILSLAIADPAEKDVLEDQINKIRRKTCDLRKMVNEVDNEFNEFARVCDSQGEVRIRKNQIDLIRKKLRDLIIRFNDTHADYRSRVSVRVRRQLRAVGENVTEEEADKIINSAGRDELFFREVNPLSVSARAALTDVKRRHNEIVELEKSIQEMQEIFVDLQNLTEIQGEIVDNIERNVGTTKTHVEEGSKNVKVALEYKKSATRKKVCSKDHIVSLHYHSLFLYLNY